MEARIALVVKGERIAGRGGRSISPRVKGLTTETVAELGCGLRLISQLWAEPKSHRRVVSGRSAVRTWCEAGSRKERAVAEGWKGRRGGAPGGADAAEARMVEDVAELRGDGAEELRRKLRPVRMKYPFGATARCPLGIWN